jgi:hypothetical protein
MNETHETYEDLAQLLHAIRAGQFPAAFADLWCRLGAADGLGVDRTYLEALGAELEPAGREISRGRYAKACSQLQKVARSLVKESRQGKNVVANDYFVAWVCERRDAIQRSILGYSDDASKLARAFGVATGAVAHALRRGAPADIETIADSAAELVPRVLRGDGVSATDARRAVETFTRDVPLKDWIAAA